MSDGLETFVISTLGGIVSGLIGLAGIHVQQRFTANTEQISATITELEAMTNACAETASRAWAKSGDPIAADTVETVCQLHALGEFIEFINVNVPNSRLRLSSALVNFRRATSGGDFDVKDRAVDPSRVFEIRSMAAALRIALRTVDRERRLFYLPFLSR